MPLPINQEGLAMKQRFLVTRDPESACGWTINQKEYSAGISVWREVISLTFCTNQGGLRKSIFRVCIDPDNFRVVAQAMMHANSAEAIKAFGAALEAGIPEPQEVWIPPSPTERAAA